MNVVDLKKREKTVPSAEVDTADEDESYAEEKAQAAEIQSVTRAPKTVLHTTYRRRS